MLTITRCCAPTSRKVASRRYSTGDIEAFSSQPFQLKRARKHPPQKAFRDFIMDATTQHHEPKHVRVEDNVLLRGNGRYIADAPLPNQAYAYFVRSPHAFARIVSVDTSAALKAPGVVGVLTAKDMDGVGNLGRHPPIPGRGGKGLILPHRPALAGERAMHIGEPVAMVVAESAAAAQDAAELVAVEYEELTPVTDAREALRDGAPQV